MPAVGEAIHTLNLSGGLNLVQPPAEIQDNQLLQADNFYYRDGKLTKRPGALKITPSVLGTSMMGLIFLGHNPLSFKHVVATRNSIDLWEFDTSGATAVTGVITNNPSWMLYVSGTTYIGFNGSMGVRTLTAGALSGAAMANSPQSDTGVYHKGRIFTNIYNQPGRIAFSDPITPTAPVAVWNALNILDIAPFDKDIITGLVSLGDLLIIFFRNSTWVLYVQGNSPADWVVRRVSNIIGAAPSRGSCSTYVYDNEVYFISQNGVYRTNGSSFVNISENIWDPFAAKFRIKYNVGLSGHWRVTSWNDSILVLGTVDTPEQHYFFVYNMPLGAWTAWTFMGAGFPFDVYTNPASTSVDMEMYISKDRDLFWSANNFVDAYDSLQAAGYYVFSDGQLISTTGVPGTSYTATFKTREFQTTLDRFIRNKWAGIEYKAYASPNFNWVRDDVASNVIAPGFNSTRRKAYKIGGAGRARSFALVGSSSANSPWEIDRVNLHVSGKDKISKLSNV